MASHQQPFKHGSRLARHLPCHFLRFWEGEPHARPPSTCRILVAPQHRATICVFLYLSRPSYPAQGCQLFAWQKAANLSKSRCCGFSSTLSAVFSHNVTDRCRPWLQTKHTNLPSTMAAHALAKADWAALWEVVAASIVAPETMGHGVIISDNWVIFPEMDVCQLVVTHGYNNWMIPHWYDIIPCWCLILIISMKKHPVMIISTTSN